MAERRFTVELERVGKTATMFRIPFDLRAAFGRARPPVLTHRREYVEWIEDAKRPKTRARRVAQTVERVRAGQPQR